MRLQLKFGVAVVVAVNVFASDTDREVELVKAKALEAGATAAVESNHWALGGKGAADLGRAVITSCAKMRSLGSPFKFLYPVELGIAEKFEVICSTCLHWAQVVLVVLLHADDVYVLLHCAEEIYGAAGVEFSEEAQKKLAVYTASGYSRLPVCCAKTHLSLSTDPTAKGVPTGFSVKVRDVRVSAGAGFIYLLCGDMMTVPGLPTRPGFYDVDLDLETGKVIGLF